MRCVHKCTHKAFIYRNTLPCLVLLVLRIRVLTKHLILSENVFKDLPLAGFLKLTVANQFIQEEVSLSAYKYVTSLDYPDKSSTT